MNKRVIESLIKAGALDSMGTRAQLMAAVDKAMERGAEGAERCGAGAARAVRLFNEAPRERARADDLPQHSGLGRISG
jgi:DNA polymerase-3 subunit alpha